MFMGTTDVVQGDRRHLSAPHRIVTSVGRSALRGEYARLEMPAVTPSFVQKIQESHHMQKKKPNKQMTSM